MVKAIILELRRRQSEVRISSVRSLSDRHINLSEDIVPLRTYSARCRTYTKLLQDTKQAIASVVPGGLRGANLDPTECAFRLKRVHFVPKCLHSFCTVLLCSPVLTNEHAQIHGTVRVNQNAKLVVPSG